MKDSGMGDNSQKLVNAGPGNRPGQSAFRQPRKDLESGIMTLAGSNLGVDKDVGVNRLHWLAPIHQVEQGIAVKQIDPGLLRRLPALKLKLVGFRGRIRQGAPKKVVGYRLQRPALF